MTPLRALHIVEWEWNVYRRAWRGSVTINFLGPIFFLTAIGLGLGSLVNRTNTLGIPYLDFLAPALVATACMQAAVGESTYPVMGKVKWDRTYEAVLATPTDTSDIILGELLWYALRQLLVAAAFVLVLFLFGIPKSPLAVLAVPAGAVTGLAFAMPIYAFAVTRETDLPFAMLFRFMIGPLFLFSGTFFPIDRLPVLMQGLAWALPLSHGVALARDLVLNTANLLDLAHLAVIAAYVAAGAVAARMALDRRLRQ